MKIENEKIERIDISKYDGMYVGSLTPNEYVAFVRAITEGKAEREYTLAGCIGLSKVRIIK